MNLQELSFQELFEQSLLGNAAQAGKVVAGKIVGIEGPYFLIDVGSKSEGIVLQAEFFVGGSLPEDVGVGSEVDVLVKTIADSYGETRLSHEEARRVKSWERLIRCFETGEPVTGLISGKVKGGLAVEIDGVKGFLPGSLVDVRPISDLSDLEGTNGEFKIIKIDQKRNNVVVSRKAVLEAKSSEGRTKLLETLEEGQILEGIVKNLTDYGAFVDLGGMDGLLHITDISWKRVKVPSEALRIGQKVKIVVLSFDKEKGRVSLGMKQLTRDPWMDIASRYPKGTTIKGKVTNITEYGCFVQLEEGIEGLVHMSEMDWTNKNIHPNKVVRSGQDVDVVILEVEEERRRISLGMKQCRENPWESFAEKRHVGDVVQGKVTSITDFGVFLGLEGGIDGLVHINDLAWVHQENCLHDYQKGQEVSAVILGIDVDRERISLGVKQLTKDIFSDYVNEHPRGTLVKGIVNYVDERQVIVQLTEEVQGRIRASEISTERVNDARERFKEGDEVEACVMSSNSKERLISLSIRAKENKEHKELMQKANDAEVVKTTVGDLIKEQIEASTE